MKILFSTVVATLLWLSSASTVANSNYVTDQQLELESQFYSWMQQHGKMYTSEQEAALRLGIWKDNNAFIVTHNSMNPRPSYQLGHNQFSDMTLEEYQAYNKLGKYSPGIVTPRSSSVREAPSEGSNTAIKLRNRGRRQLQNLPESVDWVEKGAVVPVKNQGMCGSCWAFSAIVAIEGALFLDTGNLTSLSEQELIDCDHNDLGCGGGLMDNAFLFDENSTGICSELDYPYVMHKRWLRGCGPENGECKPVEHTRVNTFVDVVNSVEALMEAIAQQPVSVAIEADTQSFQFYRSGVYADPSCGSNLDHGVAAVGYGTTDYGSEYFKVRNSWGSSWGEDGYILLSRNSPHVNGTCGILEWASRPSLRDNE